MANALVVLHKPGAVVRRSDGVSRAQQVLPVAVEEVFTGYPAVVEISGIFYKIMLQQQPRSFKSRTPRHSKIGLIGPIGALPLKRLIGQQRAHAISQFVDIVGGSPDTQLRSTVKKVQAAIRLVIFPRTQTPTDLPEITSLLPFFQLDIDLRGRVFLCPHASLFIYLDLIDDALRNVLRCYPCIAPKKRLSIDQYAADLPAIDGDHPIIPNGHTRQYPQQVLCLSIRIQLKGIRMKFQGITFHRHRRKYTHDDRRIERIGGSLHVDAAHLQTLPRREQLEISNSRLKAHKADHQLQRSIYRQMRKREQPVLIAQGIGTQYRVAGLVDGQRRGSQRDRPNGIPYRTLQVLPLHGVHLPGCRLTHQDSRKNYP